jgi:bifunctional UDP-N-acetylglucosamine pyrophosphorylase / glucosamine-1-phosphate N-acetyltransferase
MEQSTRRDPRSDLMMPRTCLSIVLAAGEGTRMRSSRPKVLHAIAQRPLISHVLAAVGEVSGSTAVVVAPGQDAVVAEVKRVSANAEVFVQSERRGTAHAVLAARPAIARGADDILIVFSDTPLIRSSTLAKMRATLADGAAVVVLGFRPADPTGYGRLVVADGRLLAIREEKDASAAERAIALCNGGLMALRGESALAVLDKIDDRNAKREYYLTDAVAVAGAMGLSVVALNVEEDEVRGINTQGQLAEAEAVLQRRLRAAALDAGVTMVAPETVYLATDTKLGRDVVIEPYVVFGLGVVVEDGATIRSFSHLEHAHIGKGSAIGPFARLRPGAKVGANVKIGNFVELKEAVLEDGVRANHLSYIGNARVGAGTNVGAGTITCNYDGINKHHTDIGKGAFIGSNAALVAPVTIGDGAYIGAGSVIARDVPANALAVGRGRQVVKVDWAARLREERAESKKKHD